MQELIELLEKSGALTEKDFLFKVSFLAKEKQQIIDAHSVGNKKGLDNIPLGAAKYYKETYQQ